MRTSPLAALLLSACAASAVPKPEVAPPSPALDASAPASSVASPDASPPPSADPSVLTDAERARDLALAPRAAAIVDAYANINGPFSPLVAQLTRDGKRVLFGSMRSGLQQLYLGEVARPADPPRALTSGAERAMWGSFTRDEKHVLFTRDEGSDENWRIYRIDLDGSSPPTCLTPGAKLHRDEPLLPRRAPDTMVYTQHETHSPASHLVVQSVSAGDPQVVYDDPAPANAADVTADGKRALLVRFNSASDLVVLDVGTTPGSSASRIYPAEGTKATVNGAAYSPDGRTVYVATDEGKEVEALVAVDVKTKAVRARYTIDDPSTALLMDPKVSPAGDRVSVLVNAGNHYEVRVLDARSLAFQRKLATPLGSAGTGPFTPDGKHFTYWFSAPDQPPEVYLADAATGESKPLRSDPRPGLESLPRVAVTIETAKAFDGLPIPVNVYLPDGDRAKKHLVIAWFHGGPSNSAAVRWHAFARFYTSMGYVVVEPNIRGSIGFGRSYEMADNREKRADVLRDMETINAWVKAQPWCDPSRVVIFGGSYGGYLTLMALTRQPALWRAGIDAYGIVNLHTFMRSTDSAIRSILKDEFGDPDQDAALLEEFSPSHDYAKITAPLFVYAGANDPRVRRSESDQIVRELRARGVPVEYMVAPNEGHSIDKRDNRITYLTRTTRFLEDDAK
jgi:dipeptidyl aminopeptidase/acylaminoacyl peptidase